MNLFFVDPPDDCHIFNIELIQSLYPNLDLSHNIYSSVCDMIDLHRKQFIVFHKGYFRDQETENLLIHGTNELLVHLIRFKKFLERYYQIENKIKLE
jgi:hypothetical protein